MLNRRLIRIKVFQTIFGHFKDENSTPSQLYKIAVKSIYGIEQHFLSVLCFLTEFRQFIQAEHNPTDFKYNASDDDKLTFSLITDSPFVDELENQELVQKFQKAPSLDWHQEHDVMFLIYKNIKKHEDFEALKSIEDLRERSFRFAVFLYKYLIKESVDFEHLMEDRIIVWYDEKIPILKNLDRMFDSFEKDNKISMPPLSRDLDGDLQFAETLIDEYYNNLDELEETLNKYTPGWESDRIMKIDYILMCMALCEFKYLNFVPVKVTINEYIEIAKMYSTPQSSKFLNGTLDKILKDWQLSGEINKTGRGLIG